MSIGGREGVPESQDSTGKCQLLREIRLSLLNIEDLVQVECELLHEIKTRIWIIVTVDKEHIKDVQKWEYVKLSL